MIFMTDCLEKTELRETMLKYLYHKTVFQEVPNEISLGISITNCQIKCKGCHSKELWKDIGRLLDPLELDSLIKRHRGITCVLLMGGEHDIPLLKKCVDYLKDTYNFKCAWYTGLEFDDALKVLDTLRWRLDYIKTGPYKEELGGLSSPETNQRFFEVNKEKKQLVDKTELFKVIKN